MYDKVFNPCDHVRMSVLGYIEEEVVGKRLQFLQGSGTDSESSQAFKLLSEALSNHDPSQVVVLNYKKNGDPFWCMIEIAPLRRPDGTVLACVGHLTDVTKKDPDTGNAN